MWKPLPLRMAGNAAAIRNARSAVVVLARQRREREAVEAFLAASSRRDDQPLSA